MPKPVIVRYPANHPALAGAEYELPNTETARKAHPDADVIRYADGTPHPSAPKDIKAEAERAEKDRAAREAAAAQATKAAEQQQATATKEADANAKVAAAEEPAAKGEKATS